MLHLAEERLPPLALAFLVASTAGAGAAFLSFLRAAAVIISELLLSLGRASYYPGRLYPLKAAVA